MRTTTTNSQLTGIADIIIENMDSGVLLLNQEREIKAINYAGQTLLQDREQDFYKKPFGNAIGCENATNGVNCGHNPMCHDCSVLRTINGLSNDIRNLAQKRVERKKVIRKKETVEKYFQFTFKLINIESESNVLILIDDITDLEKHKRTVVEKNKQLVSSINYAKRIQDALLPSDFEINNNLKDYFLIYQPRDIIGGDFYWNAKIDDKIIIALADCTGHGIPGALLTILGISSLNEIVINNKVTSPDKILNRLREQIVNELNKANSENNHDGMDMGVCTIDTGNKTIRFAGAFNDLIFINKGAFKEIKGNKMPIGLFSAMDKFTLHEFKYAQGDYFYLFSDGFKDQFGGPKGKKFGKVRFIELLKQIHNKESAVQKEILLENFKEWKKNEHQVDDIAVLGVKLI